MYLLCKQAIHGTQTTISVFHEKWAKIPYVSSFGRKTLSSFSFSSCRWNCRHHHHRTADVKIARGRRCSVFRSCCSDVQTAGTNNSPHNINQSSYHESTTALRGYSIRRIWIRIPWMYYMRVCKHWGETLPWMSPIINIGGTCTTCPMPLITGHIADISGWSQSAGHYQQEIHNTTDETKKHKNWEQ